MSDGYREEIKDLLISILDGAYTKEDLQSNTQIGTELIIDSIAYIQFIVLVEEKYDCLIPDDLLDNTIFSTYGELENRLNESLLSNVA